MNASKTPHGSIALDFVQALVSGDLIKARGYLSAPVKDDIQNELEAMIGYGDVPVNRIEVMKEMSNWPQLSHEDIGWAYVAIAGSGYSEGVAVIISKVNRVDRITSIEWGRP